MNSNIVLAVIVSAIAFGTPLVLAGLGELLAERSGVLNLGVEGMMLMGAVTRLLRLAEDARVERWLVLVLAVLAGMAAGAVDGPHPRLLDDHHPCQPDRLGARPHDLRRASSACPPISGRSGTSAEWPGHHQFNKINLFGLERTCRSSARSSSTRTPSSTSPGCSSSPSSTTCTGPGPGCTCGPWARTRLRRTPWGST